MRLNLVKIVVVFITMALPGYSLAETPIRIATFNAEILTAPGVKAGELQKYRWDVAREEQFERVAAVIEAINPDVLNLIEVTSREGVDLLIDILHQKGMTEFQGYHVEGQDTFTGMDVALISKIKPDKVDGEDIRLYYSTEDNSPWREKYQTKTRDGKIVDHSTGIARHATYFLTIGEHKFGFLGLHLKSNPSSYFANAKRSAQANIAKRIILQEIVNRGYQPIVLGDINDFDPDVPDQDESQGTLTNVVRDLKDYDSKIEGPELVNVAKLIPRQADRYTSFWDRNENGARDPYDVFSMIDHIFLPKQLMPHVKRAFIFHCVDLETSDHRAVVVDLLLPTSSVAVSSVAQ